jgi:hypothetical protein
MPASKYQPLADFLSGQLPETASVTLTLPEVEAVLGQELPLSAHRHTWWRNDPSQSQSRVWLGAGWRVTHAQVKQAPSAITFTRASPATATPLGD